jgi:hypothetical protein
VLAAPAIVQAQAKTPDHPVSQQQSLVLNGQVRGIYSTPFTNPDIGKSQVLTGQGKVAPLGSVKLRNSSLHLTGFIAQGHATGTVTLSGAKGSVTLTLVGPTQPGFSGPPSSFSYLIQGGTGAYKNAKGSGQLSLQETPSNFIMNIFR